MDLSGQARSSFVSGSLSPKFSSKKVEFPISRFNVKNGVSSGHVNNPLPPVNANLHETIIDSFAGRLFSLCQYLRSNFFYIIGSLTS